MSIVADVAETAVKVALPWWAPWVGGIAAVAIVFGAYEAWAYHERKLGEQEFATSEAKKAEDQAKSDLKLSNDIKEKQQAYIADLEQSGQKVREVIRNVPSTCKADTTLDTVADWVTQRLQSVRPADSVRSSP